MPTSFARLCLLLFLCVYPLTQAVDWMQLAGSAPDPQDPPFDLTKVLFSGTFSSHVVLQRAPQRASVFGTATNGASVIIHLSGPDGYQYTSDPALVASSPDPALHGTWKVLLPPQPAGFGYTIEAQCDACLNVTTTMLTDVGFGDVWLCSGQSNMEDPVLTTIGRNDSYAQVAAGKYDHIRIFQTGCRFQRKTSTWILPQEPDDGQCYPRQDWELPVGCPDGTSCSLTRFSAVCWYFGKSLADLMADTASGEVVPIGLIHSSIGGTTIQHWMPPSTIGNDTCKNNNCGFVEQLNPGEAQPSTLPQCTDPDTSTVWNCPSEHCSELWNGMISPYVNMTIAGVVWYQGEQNVGLGRGSDSSGYQCQQKALISSWREAFSALEGTTAADFPFGVTSLAGGANEEFPLWSSYQHATQADWLSCATNRSKQRLPLCQDMVDDWNGGLRVAQTGGHGHLPNSDLPNVFLGQAYDHGEPCACDQRAQPPDGCWANEEQCYGWESEFSLNRTWNYQISTIHPRPKLMVGKRLARGAFALMQNKPQAVPKLAGCRLESASQLVLSFDHGLLAGEEVSLQKPSPGEIPLELRVGLADDTTSAWIYAVALDIINSTAILVTLPANASTPTAVRYAWQNQPCCPGLDPKTRFCPPAACPIVTDGSKEPAVPFWAYIEKGRCRCDDPWECSA